MDFCYNICFYEADNAELFNKVNFEDLKCFGFKTECVNGAVQKLLSHLNFNKPDILVFNLFKSDKESFLYLFDIIYNNFCKNVLIITDCEFNNLQAHQILLEDFNNLELKLVSKLMDIKRDIELSPSKNINFLKIKVNNILDDFLFSSRHDGYKYYSDAVILAYMKKPNDYSMMELYKEVADLYGKTVCAVEKSMRTALIYAFNKLKNAPKTIEFEKRRGVLTYDLNNNTAIGLMLNMLLNDEFIKEDFSVKKEAFFRQ